MENGNKTIFALRLINLFMVEIIISQITNLWQLLQVLWLSQISVEYAKLKGLAVDDEFHKVVARKWNNVVKIHKKKRSEWLQAKHKTGGGSPPPPLERLTEIVLAAAQTNAVLPSTTDCEAPSSDPRHENEETGENTLIFELTFDDANNNSGG